MITLHGRTRCQFFKGSADWKGIRKTVNRTNIPVIANGDIVDIKTALTALNHSKASGIMIGRGVTGKPWLLSEISSSIYGTEAPRVPFGTKLGEMIISHYEDVLSFYGKKLGVKQFRKHINWYLKPIVKHDCKIRKRAVIEEDPKLIIKMIKFLFENTNFEKEPYETF
ncbi:MAG: tRNA-dihydrouridine synthase [Paracoccaceae bacterium]